MSFRVRFRTGRDRNESEAKASVGNSRNSQSIRFYSESRSPKVHPAKAPRPKIPYPKDLANVDRLHSTMQRILHGLQTTQDTEELHLLIGDAALVLGALLALYDSTEIIRTDAHALLSIVAEKRDRLLMGSVPRTRSQLRLILRNLKRIVPRGLEQPVPRKKSVYGKRSLNGKYW